MTNKQNSLRQDLMHILLTGEAPKGNLRVMAPSLDVSRQIDSILQAFSKVCEEAKPAKQTAPPDCCDNEGGLICWKESKVNAHNRAIDDYSKAIKERIGE